MNIIVGLDREFEGKGNFHRRSSLDHKKKKQLDSTVGDDWLSFKPTI